MVLLDHDLKLLYCSTPTFSSATSSPAAISLCNSSRNVAYSHLNIIISYFLSAALPACMGYRSGHGIIFPKQGVPSLARRVMSSYHVGCRDLASGT